MFGCCVWNSSIALIVRLWRSCEPHQAKRSSTGCELAAAAVVGCPAGTAPGAGALGELHADTTRATSTNTLCHANTELRRMPLPPPWKRGDENVFSRLQPIYQRPKRVSNIAVSW